MVIRRNTSPEMASEEISANLQEPQDNMRVGNYSRTSLTRTLEANEKLGGVFFVRISFVRLIIKKF